MNFHYLLMILLFIAGLVVGCAAEDPGVLSDAATDAGQTFHVGSVFRISQRSSLTQIIVEGHQYVIYSGHYAGGITHSASCPNTSHPVTREIY